MTELARSNSWQTSDNFPDMSAGKCDFLVFSLIMLPGHIPFEHRQTCVPLVLLSAPPPLRFVSFPIYFLLHTLYCNCG